MATQEEPDHSTYLDILWEEDEDEDEDHSDEDDEDEHEAHRQSAEIKHCVVHSNSNLNQVRFELWVRPFFKVCVWETEWPEEWYIEDDCDWSNTHLCLVVPRDPDSRPFLQSYVRGLEILSMTVYYDVLN